MEIISREEAIKKGLTRYFTGLPCVNGHISERSTADRNCRACVNERRSKKTQFKVDFHKYRPDFKLICYGCKKEIIREGQKARNGAFYCSISDTYKERNYCSKRCQDRETKRIQRTLLFNKGKVDLIDQILKMRQIN